MKKITALLIALAMIVSIAACGKENFTWTREGYFTDDDSNLVYISKSEDPNQPGWVVGCILEEGMHGAVIQQEGKTLKGDILSEYEEGEPFIVTVSEEGEDGIVFAIKDGATYHLKYFEQQEASIVVTVNTEGNGTIAYAEGSEEPQFDDEYPYQSAYIGIAEPETYTIAARPDEGWKFHNWTKNGEEYSTELSFTAELDESAELVAHFGIAGTDETPVDLASATTLGQLLGLPNYGYSAGDGKYILGFEQDWNIYRAVAEMPEDVERQFFDLDWDDENYDEKIRELIAPLKIVSIDNLSENLPTQAEMDALVGKTCEELFSDGWYNSGWNLDEMVFYMSKGPYDYIMELDGEVKNYDEFDEDDLPPLKVKSVRFDRIGDPTAF